MEEERGTGQLCISETVLYCQDSRIPYPQIIELMPLISNPGHWEGRETIIECSDTHSTAATLPWDLHDTLVEELHTAALRKGF